MGIFSKYKYKIKDDDLQNHYIVRLDQKKKSIKINSKLVVPVNSLCIVCYNYRPTDILTSGEYVLNGASLPNLFQKARLNVPNSTGRMPVYFKAQIYFLSLGNCLIDFDLKKFIIRDVVYGKVKATLNINANFKIIDAIKFFKILLHEYPLIRTDKVLDVLLDWFRADITSFLQEEGFTLDEIMNYTEIINSKLYAAISKRFEGIGLTIEKLAIADVVLPDKIIRDMCDKQAFSRKIKRELSDFDAVINNDGSFMPINFVQSDQQVKTGILNTNYANITNANNPQEEYTAPVQRATICPECMHPVPDGANYCPYCSAVVLSLTTNTCPHCGANNVLSATTCFNCGYDFTKKDE